MMTLNVAHCALSTTKQVTATCSVQL